MNLNSLSPTVKAMLAAGTNGWRDIASNATDLGTAVDQAAALAVTLVQISEYCGQQGGYGCGARPHDEAVKACNKKKVQVRKAIGYSYP